ncbi:MAG TPA: hypothetical protein VHU16_01855 [Candidatus Udaeobacter sp.]|nr:hypothetical protein [Candidatus Udaeobacter sp.]
MKAEFHASNRDTYRTGANCGNQREISHLVLIIVIVLPLEIPIFDCDHEHEYEYELL